MDNLTKNQRSYCMSRIRSKDTKVEFKFRRYIRSKNLKGFRTKAKIPGKPDLFHSRKKIAVFIDGCFWHKCPKCFVKPKSKNRYWDKKIRNNVGRDKEINLKLKKRGITVVRFWEHNIKRNIDKCYSKLKKIYEKKANNN